MDSVSAEAMEVTSSGPQTIQKAQGATVNLACTYIPSPQDVGELDIEWFNLSPDMTQKDKLVRLVALRVRGVGGGCPTYPGTPPPDTK